MRKFTRTMDKASVIVALKRGYNVVFISSRWSVQYRRGRLNGVPFERVVATNVLTGEAREVLTKADFESCHIKLD